MNEENVAIRLKGFIDEKGLTNSEFADRCGIPRPSLSQLLSGRNKKVSDDLVGKIHRVYPDLSVLWLLFGEGDMFVGKKDNEATDDINSEKTDENPENALDYTGEDKYSNLKALNEHKNSIKSDKRQQVEYDARLDELQLEIEKLRKSPRKVSQITIYYDDSTFETFVPATQQRGR